MASANPVRRFPVWTKQLQEAAAHDLRRGRTPGSKSLADRRGALVVSKAIGEIFVLTSDSGTGKILGFAASASGNLTPIQTIAGSATQFLHSSGPCGNGVMLKAFILSRQHPYANKIKTLTARAALIGRAVERAV